MRHSRECLTSVVRYSCERLTTLARHSCECLTTFVRILISFISRNHVSKWSYLCRIFVVLCRSGKLPCDVFANVWEGWQRVGDGLATYAMTWRRFCDDFCRTKMYYMFKTLANRSRSMQRLCDTMRTFRDSSRWFCESIFKPIANSSHPIEIRAYVTSGNVCE